MELIAGWFLADRWDERNLTCLLLLSDVREREKFVGAEQHVPRFASNFSRTASHILLQDIKADQYMQGFCVVSRRHIAHWRKPATGGIVAHRHIVHWRKSDN